MMKKIVIASNNVKKILELKNKLVFSGFDVSQQSNFNIDSIKETGLTFIENAILKARNVTKKTGYASIADDSGLTIDALQGKPGIYSNRYSGINYSDKKNIKKILFDLKYVPKNKRQARFHCVLVFMTHYYDPVPIISYGYCDGFISFESIGTNGFGYDSIFYIPIIKKTFAEMTKKEKSIFSHRCKALNVFLKKINNV